MTNPTSDTNSSMRGRIRRLWGEGLVRRVVAEKNGRRVVDIPLTAFLIAAVLAPWLVALGGVAGILLGYQFRVDHDERAEGPGAEAPLAGSDSTATPESSDL